MLRGLRVGALALLVAAFAIAPAADAKPRTITFPGEHQFELGLRGSNGYKLLVATAGARELFVTAVRDTRDGSSTYIVPRHRYGKRGFAARLPGIGRFAVEFRPVGRAREIPVFPECRGRAGKYQAGVFAGTIEFHGERGYTELSATRAKGSLIRTFPETCEIERGPGKGSEEAPRATELIASSHHHGTTTFSASLLEPKRAPPLLIYWASQFRRTPGMKIFRIVNLSPRSTSTLTAEHSGSAAAATVNPPAPFTGNGEFAIAADGAAAWSGDLSVSFPGTGPINLTGSRFEARLCVGNRCAGDPLASSSAAPTPRPWLR